MTFYRDVKCKKSSIKLDYLVPRGGLEPPRREALTPEASVSTNSTTAAQSVVDGVHVMRQVASRQLSDANFQWFLPALLKYSTKCWLLRQAAY